MANIPLTLPKVKMIRRKGKGKIIQANGDTNVEFYDYVDFNARTKT